MFAENCNSRLHQILRAKVFWSFFNWIPWYVSSLKWSFVQYSLCKPFCAKLFWRNFAFITFCIIFFDINTRAVVRIKHSQHRIQNFNFDSIRTVPIQNSRLKMNLRVLTIFLVVLFTTVLAGVISSGKLYSFLFQSVLFSLIPQWHTSLVDESCKRSNKDYCESYCQSMNQNWGHCDGEKCVCYDQ